MRFKNSNDRRSEISGSGSTLGSAEHSAESWLITGVALGQTGDNCLTDMRPVCPPAKVKPTAWIRAIYPCLHELRTGNLGKQCMLVVTQLIRMKTNKNEIE